MGMRIDEVLSAYIKLRDKKEEIENRHKEELAPLKQGMTKIENWLHAQMLEDGVDNYKAKGVGTAYMQRVSSVSVKDWSNTLNFIINNKEWSFLEARVSKAAVQDYLDSKGVMPPGVEMTNVIVVRVRR